MVGANDVREAPIGLRAAEELENGLPRARGVLAEGSRGEVEAGPWRSDTSAWPRRPSKIRLPQPKDRPKLRTLEQLLTGH